MGTTDSILLTLFNRDPRLVSDVLQRIGQNDLTATEVVLVDDGSSISYAEVIDAHQRAGMPIRSIRVETLVDLPDTYHVGGYKNPAYAWRKAVENARGERLWFLSSDTFLAPNCLARARSFNLAEAAYHARTINSTGEEFCGPTRLMPLGWFLGVRKADYDVMGGHDLGFMRGLACEDNDFSGSVLKHVGCMAVDMQNTVVHQSHPQSPYMTTGQAAWEINRRYLFTKWSGRPPLEHGSSYSVTWRNGVAYMRPVQ